MVGSRLQKVKPSHDQGQDATTFDWRSNQQTQGGKVLQQIGFDLGDTTTYESKKEMNGRLHS